MNHFAGSHGFIGGQRSGGGVSNVLQVRDDTSIVIDFVDKVLHLRTQRLAARWPG